MLVIPYDIGLPKNLPYTPKGSPYGEPSAVGMSYSYLSKSISFKISLSFINSSFVKVKPLVIAV